MMEESQQSEVGLAEQIERRKLLVTVPMTLFLENAQSTDFTRETINELFQEVFSHLSARHTLEFLDILRSFIRRSVESKDLYALVFDVLQRANDPLGGARQSYLKRLATDVCTLCKEFRHASEVLNWGSNRIMAKIWASREAAPPP